MGHQQLQMPPLQGRHSPRHWHASPIVARLQKLHPTSDTFCSCFTAKVVALRGCAARVQPFANCRHQLQQLLLPMTAGCHCLPEFLQVKNREQTQCW